MSIVRDESDERQTHVDRMIEEFREAQSRRLAKAATVKDGGRVVEFEREFDTQAAAARSTTTPHTSH
jgi:hypothetical protein